MAFGWRRKARGAGMEANMKKQTKSRIIRAGSVSRETRATVIGMLKEFGSDVLYRSF